MVIQSINLLRKSALVVALCAYVALIIYVQAGIRRMRPPRLPQRLAITMSSDHHAFTVTGLNRGEQATAVLLPALQTPGSITTFRYTWISPSDTCVVGRQLWMACGINGVIAYDISNPAAPQALLTLSVADKAWKICIGANTLYVATINGIYAFDINDLNNPLQKWHILPGHHVVSIALEGNLLAAASRTAEIILYDVNPGNRPRQLGRIAADKSTTKLLLHHKVLYYTEKGQLYHCDVSKPVQALTRHACPLNGLVIHSMALHHDMLYLGCGNQGLYRVDAVRPDSPRLCTAVSAHSISIAGNKLIASGFSRIVNLFQLYNDGSVELKKRFLLHGRCNHLRLYGRYAVGQILRYGFAIIDTSRTGMISTADLPLHFANRRMAQLVTLGDIIVLCWKKSLQLIRYNRHSGLQPMAHMHTSGPITAVCQHNGTLYLSVLKKGIMRLDTNKHGDWQLTPLLSTTAKIRYLYASADTLYLGTKRRGVFTIPSTTSSNVIPRQLLSVKEIKAMTIDNRRIYILDCYKGLLIYALHDGQAKLEQHLIYQQNMVKSQPRSLAIHADHAYIPSETMGLLSININHGKQPQIADFINLPEFPSRVKVHAGYAYVNDGIGNINVIDISNPRAMKFVCRLHNLWDITFYHDTLIGINDSGLVRQPLPQPLPASTSGIKNTFALPTATNATTAVLQISTGKEALRHTSVLAYTPQHGWQIIEQHNE